MTALGTGSAGSLIGDRRPGPERRIAKTRYQ
jgi:hypothetical protein